MPTSVNDAGCMIVDIVLGNTIGPLSATKVDTCLSGCSHQNAVAWVLVLVLGLVPVVVLALEQS